MFVEDTGWSVVNLILAGTRQDNIVEHSIRDQGGDPIPTSKPRDKTRRRRNSFNECNSLSTHLPTANPLPSYSPSTQQQNPGTRKYNIELIPPLLSQTASSPKHLIPPNTSTHLNTLIRFTIGLAFNNFIYLISKSNIFF